MSETSKKIGDFQGLCENLPEGIMNVIFHVIEWVLNGFSSKKQWYLFSIQDAWHFPSKIGI